MIYLATPYSHPNHHVMESRFEQACEIAGKLMAQGEIVFCPIAHTHPIAVRCQLPRGWDYWQKYDTEMIRCASRVIVAMMDGWKESKGIAGEIEIAEGLDIPVEYIEI